MQSQSPLSETTQTRRVWDRFLRFFHWSLVLCFAAAFISGERHAALLHELVGYVLCVLVLARVYWGFRGSQYSRFSSFFFSLKETMEYARAMFSGNPRHYFGHNPAGALMVFALLVLLLVIFASGLLSFGTIDFDGPLAFLANEVSDEASYVFRHLHGFLTHAALILVALHLAGVVVGSKQHKENLVRAMITGNKQIPSHNHTNND